MRDVFIIGDSHADALRSAFLSHGWRVHGGALHMGRTFEAPFFDVSEGHLSFHDELAQANFARALSSAGVARMADLQMPVLSTMGFNTNRLAGRLWIKDGDKPSDEPPTWSQAVVEAVVEGARASILEFYRRLPKGRTFALLSPQRARTDLISTIVQVEDIFARKLADLGVRIVDVRRETIDSDGVLRSEFWRVEENDHVHANEAYGSVVMRRFEQMLAVQPDGS